MYDLKERSIIVTGGGSGIGRETALLAAKAGAKVTVADITVAAGEETVKLITDAGGIAQFIRTDIGDEAQIEAMVAKAVATYGKLDGAHNNAAIPQIGVPVEQLTAAQFRRALDINVTGTFLCLKYEILAMQKTGGGAIVNTASAAGLTAFPGASDYVTSKHAVVGLTKAAALDVALQNIRVNCVCPGAIRTPMLIDKVKDVEGLEDYLINQQPTGRLGLPAEIATSVVWLLSDHASFVTGAAFAIDGGWTAK